jgi:uncharacterized protein (TIGR02271 family)
MPKNNEDRPPDRVVVPVIEEEVVAGIRPVTTGGVRIEKHVETRSQKIEVPVVREEVEVRRVPVNRIVSELPATREEGDLLIVPVVEEELVVEKRLVLKEEIHIQKKRFKDDVVKEVEVKRERAAVQRLDEHGRAAPSGEARAPKIRSDPTTGGQR